MPGASGASSAPSRASITCRPCPRSICLATAPPALSGRLPCQATRAAPSVTSTSWAGQKPHLLIKTSQQSRRRNRGHVRPLHQVLSARQASRHTVDHQAAVPRALRGKSHRYATSGAKPSLPAPIATITATSMGSSASFAASVGSSKGTSNPMASSCRAISTVPTSPDQYDSISPPSRPSPGTTPARPSSGIASSRRSSTSMSPFQDSPNTSSQSRR